VGAVREKFDVSDGEKWDAECFRVARNARLEVADDDVGAIDGSKVKRRESNASGMERVSS
jgi:hypothetical protein